MNINKTTQKPSGTNKAEETTDSYKSAEQTTDSYKPTEQTTDNDKSALVINYTNTRRYSHTRYSDTQIKILQHPQPTNLNLL